MNYARGSLWHKWDLHVHTPESLVNNYTGTKEEQWDRFLDELENLPPEFKVIGINDYIFIDGYRRVLSERKNGRLQNLDLVLPVIELRLDMFAGTEGSLSKVNLHIVFSDEVSPNTIEAQFISALPNKYNLSVEAGKTEWAAIPTRDSLADLGQLILDNMPAEKRPGISPIQLGFSNITFSVDKVQEILRGSYFKDQHLIGVGKTEWADMRWGQNIAEKRNIIQSSDIVFTAAESPQVCERARSKLQEEGVNDRLLDCSDAHYFSDCGQKDRVGNCCTWIKADTTFDGLCHALREYEGRVFLGEEPRKIGSVRSQGSRYIGAIEIRKKQGAECPEEWFDCELELNHDLVAIVGRKGSGKSALTDTIGLLADAGREGSYSFLNSDRFREKHDNKACSFRGLLRFENGHEVEKGLDEHVDSTAPRRVNYIPQSFFENLCSEIVRGTDTAFQRELESVIFGRLSPSQRLGRSTLRDLIEYRSNQVDAAITMHREELELLNTQIAEAERESQPDRRDTVEKALKLREAELADHEKAKPEEVAKPKPGEEGEAPPDEKALLEAQKAIAEIKERIADAETEHRTATLALAALERVEGALTNLEERFRRTQSEVKADLELLEVPWNDVARLTIERKPLADLREKWAAREKGAAELLNKESSTGLEAQKAEQEKKTKDLTEKLGEPERLYQERLKALGEWDVTRKTIIGDPRSPGTIEELRARLIRINGLPTLLDEKRKRRLEVSGEIYQRLQELQGHYRELYGPVQEFVDGHKTVKKQLNLTFTVHMRDKGFQNQFLQQINRNVRGTFSGPQGVAYLSQIVEETDFNDKDNTLALLERIDACLHREKGDRGGEEYVLDLQIRKGATAEDVYSHIFGLKYLEPQYTLTLGGKPLSTLSPGERGALLLIFYLLVDESRCPVVLDQPDENLDNETVYELLVPCIREAKRDRQLIVVTHNPNIAVVCDAEQVIHAKIDKAADNRVTYTTGAIENPTMNKHLMDVLEGTRPAFQNRDDKYF